jgi:hypothetical protein
MQVVLSSIMFITLSWSFWAKVGIVVMTIVLGFTIKGEVQ